MLDAFLTEALRRLDARLLDVCDDEERRAPSCWPATAARAGRASATWPAPAMGDLSPSEPVGDESLLPPTGHTLRRIGGALQLDECELEALLVALAPHLEARYQSIYAVLQDDLNQPQPTKRLLYAVLGREPRRRRILRESLGPAGRLGRSGLLVRRGGSFPPLAHPLELPEDAVAALLGSAEPAVPQASSQVWGTGTGPEGSPAAWQVVYGAGDRAALARTLAGAGTRVVEVVVPAAAAAAAACQAAWRVGLATGALTLLDLADLDERDAAAVARQVAGLVQDLGGRAWLLCRHPLPLPIPYLEATSPSWATRRQAWLEEARRRGVTLDPPKAGRLATRHRLDAPEIRQVFEAAAAWDTSGRRTSAGTAGRWTYSLLTSDGRNGQGGVRVSPPPRLSTGR